MSDKVARTHTHISNRDKARKALEKKVAFKNVLDNPFRIPWPSVPINTQNKILELLLSMLEGIAKYQNARWRENKKRKRSNNNGRNTGAEMDVIMTADHIPTATEVLDEPTTPPPQEILQHLTIGINEVTKRLESQVRGTRTCSTISPTGPVDPPVLQAQIKIVFACRADVNPPILVAHIPHLVAAFNSAPKTDPVKLVPLPLGAETSLAQALGLRRVSILAADIDLPLPEPLVSLLDSVPTLTAVWLAPPRATQTLVSTHIKQTQTTSPKDMRVAKEQRAQGRKAANLRRKETGKKKSRYVSRQSP